MYLLRYLKPTEQINLGEKQTNTGKNSVTVIFVVKSSRIIRRDLQPLVQGLEVPDLGLNFLGFAWGIPRVTHERRRHAELSLQLAEELALYFVILFGCTSSLGFWRTLLN